MEQDFRAILEQAIAGSKHSVKILLQMYGPLINGHSYLRGKLDEDLKQYIIIHIIKKLPKFKNLISIRSPDVVVIHFCF